MIIEVGEAVSPSSAGRGGESADGKPEAKPAHRYIYYRLYTKDGALESNSPIYANDRFISRVVAKHVAPPHTGASIKKHLCRIEGFEGLGNGSLYASLGATTHLEDSARLSLRGNDGPGSTEAEPMALMVETSALEKRLAANRVDPKTLPERRDEPRYVYYHVYDEGGQVISKTSFNEDDSSLGRIDALSVPPPHTVSSLRSRLVEIEKISSQDVQLFEDEYGEANMNADAIALSSDHYPGIAEDEPIAIVYESRNGDSESKIQKSAPPADLGFSKQVRVKGIFVHWNSPDPKFHSLTNGEILKTDGIMRKECFSGGTITYECYVAINLAGKKALIMSGNAEFC